MTKPSQLRIEALHFPCAWHHDGDNRESEKSHHSEARRLCTCLLPTAVEVALGVKQAETAMSVPSPHGPGTGFSLQQWERFKVTFLDCRLPCSGFFYIEDGKVWLATNSPRKHEIPLVTVAASKEQSGL